MKFNYKLFQKLLKETGGKQKDIVEYTGKNRQSVSAWYNGRYNPNPFVIGLLAQYFGVKYNDFIINSRRTRKPASRQSK